MWRAAAIWGFGIACAWDGYLVGSHAAAWQIVLMTVWTVPASAGGIYLVLHDG